MSLKQSAAALGSTPVAYPSIAGHVVTQRYAYSLAGDEAGGDIIELAPIPPGCRAVDMVFDSDDLDDGTALVFDVGIMSGSWGVNDAARTCGAEFFSGATIGQAGGLARPTLASAYRTTATDYARSIGVKVATAAGTGKAGEIGLTVSYVA